MAKFNNDDTDIVLLSKAVNATIPEVQDFTAINATSRLRVSSIKPKYPRASILVRNMISNEVEALGRGIIAAGGIIVRGSATDDGIGKHIVAWPD